MGRKMRMLLSVSILAGTFAWIVLSYLPSGHVSLPQFHFSPDGVVRVFPGVLIAGFFAFVVLQLWVLQTTVKSIRHYKGIVEGAASDGFDLTVRREAILTALPILFTLAVAGASYGWWQRMMG